MGGVGINAIAKRAGVSKELIYRYFDGMPGLMLAWMREQDFWTRNPGLLLSDEGQPAHAGRPGAVHVARAGRGPWPATRHLREVRRWELIERNEVSAPLTERRRARASSTASTGSAPAWTRAAVVSVMLAGVLYLRAKTESHFLGLPLREPEGWRRIDAALEHLVSGGFPEPLRSASLAELEAERKPSAAPDAER